jgi:hypothetical protein
LITTIQSSFANEPSNESVHFRNFILKMLKQAFLVVANNNNNNNNTDLERCLSMIFYILSKTESNQVFNQDAEVYFSQILLLIGNESNALKTKALNIFNLFIVKLKETFITDEM